MRHIFFLGFFGILFSSVSLYAQKTPRYSEYGITAGNLVYSGQFAMDNSMGNWLKEGGGRFGIFLRRSMAPWINFGLEANYGWYSLNDANHGRVQRGVSVHTQVVNANFATEIILLKYGKYHWANTFAPYLKLGFGGNFFSPEVENFGNLNFEEVNVHPYSYQSINGFYGVGVKFRTSYKTTLAIEVVSHNSGTRKMGGVEAIAINPRNDRYGSVLIHFSTLIF
ncbi:MAG: hypothetical protein JJU02_14160 [Cryomorphaceae bacterium]|nr:hypothetical protein [Cryomorphaceae bacterium]